MKKLLASIFVCGLFDKMPWARRVKNRCVDKLRFDYQVALKFTSVKCKNWRSIEIKGLHIRLEKYNVEIDANLVSILPAFSGFFKRSAKSFVKELTIDSLCITMQKSATGASVAEAIEQGENSNLHQRWQQKYYPVFKRAMNAGFRIFNHKISVNEIVAFNNQRQLPVTAKSVAIRENEFSLEVRIFAKHVLRMYQVAGQGNIEARSLTAKILPVHTSPDFLPLFQTLQFAFREERDDVNDGSRFNVNFEAKDLCVDNKKVCATPFMIRSIELDLLVNFSKELFVITDESGGVIDDLPFTLSVSHETKESDLLRVSFFSDIDFDCLLKNFPFLAANAMKNCSISGNLLIRCRLMFVIDKAREHFFDIKILENNVVIENVADNAFSRLNTSSLENIFKLRNSGSTDELYVPNFISLQHLPSRAIEILLFSEDPNFYQHAGVDVFFMGSAIVTNMVTRKFSRGASTITMQLARNLFLNHEKDLVRKLEEIGIALLIENHFQIPKNRLLEIYFNIIEFGPAIYGITDAARFYFGKLPDELSITEWIVITYIIPRPIHFYDALKEKTAQLRRNLGYHIHFFSTNLLQKKMITEMEYQSIPSNICFNKQFGTIELDIDKGSYQANGVLSYTSNNGGWRLANSLVVLQNQINSMAPLRNKASDGTIGNESHSKKTSDHNPHIFDQESGLGIVTAMDITHDPKHDFDCNVFAESLVKNKDGRVKYIIWNNRIINSEKQVGYLAWTWRDYTGANPHRKHLHISVKNDKENYDAMSNWRLT